MSQKPNKASRSIAELEHENSMLRAEIDDLKLKLEHMNEILVNMQSKVVPLSRPRLEKNA